MVPKPLDLLRLWCLATRGGEAQQNEIRPEMKKAHRLLYMEQNLIEQTHTRPTIRVRLSDQGWSFLLKHMTDQVNARTYAAGTILTDVFAALHRILQERDIDIRTVFSLPDAASETSGASSLWSGFHRIWEKKHLPDGGLLLRDLRPALLDVSREKLDAALLAWQDQDKIELFPFDDMSRITPEDRAAAIEIAGRDAYIILLK